MLHAIALATLSLNKIVESLFHLLETNRINDAAKDNSAWTVRLYIKRDLINNLKVTSAVKL